MAWRHRSVTAASKAVQVATSSRDRTRQSNLADYAGAAGGGAGLAAARPVELERWFAREGAPPRLDLARSGAPALTIRDLLRMAGIAASEAYFSMSLDYGEAAGAERLRRAVAAAEAARDSDQVLVTTGAVEALLLACAAAGRGGRRTVLVGVPAYEGLIRAPAAAGLRVEEVELARSSTGRIDLAPVKQRLSPDLAAVLLNSPANPTGATVDDDDLSDLAGACADLGVLLIVDEVARGTLNRLAPSSCQSAAFGSGSMVVIGDVSKSFGLGGLRVGWLTCTDQRVLSRAAAVKDMTSLANAVPSETLAAIALEHREVILQRVQRAAEENLVTLTRWVGSAEASLIPPVDGLVAAPSLPRADDPKFLRRLRRDFGVSLVAGSTVRMAGHVRVGLGVDPAAFALGLEGIGDALNQLRAD